MSLLSLAARLRPLGRLFWLDSAGGPPSRARFSFLGAGPVEILEAYGRRLRIRDQGGVWREEEGDPFFALERFWQRARARALPGATARPVCVGYLAYDLGALPQGLSLPRRASLPDLFFASYDAVLAFEHLSGRYEILGDPVRGRLLAEALEGPEIPLAAAPMSATLDTSREEYGLRFRQAREHILAGDIYQANLSLGLTARLSGDPLALYGRLREAARVPFGAFLEDGQGAVLSASMERFLRGRLSEEGSYAETCPIKGTRPRGRTPAEDKALAEALLGSEKDQAEHVMIVDLERNDLGRVAKIGSVKVTALAALCSYATVHHLESTVHARLRPEVGLGALLSATFPTGSITGAPKRRAMEIIAALEKKPRGVYCGSIGYLDDQGGFDFSVAIRTAEVRAGQIFYRAGGGIVAGSEEEEEWRECSWKARAFLQALGGEVV